jgi:hypothetical protein
MRLSDTVVLAAGAGVIVTEPVAGNPSLSVPPYIIAAVIGDRWRNIATGEKLKRNCKRSCRCIARITNDGVRGCDSH